MRQKKCTEKRRIIYGDIHGCIDELIRLHQKLKQKYPGAEHWSLGDIVDRGPNSRGCLEYVQDNFDGAILGNHENTLLDIMNKNRAYGYIPKNPDKSSVFKQMSSRQYHYMKSLPPIHVFDDVGLIIVHGGVVPGIPLYKQKRELCIRAQMVKPGQQELMNRWWGKDSTKQPEIEKTEAESYAEGYRRWYELYDDEYDCIFGHSVLGLKPFIYQNPGYGKTIGIDTGSCFGGYLTACIYPDLIFEQEKCKCYVIGRNVKTIVQTED